MNTVIYYPFLCPPPKWLKLAALCWDKIYTIKPRNAPDDSEEVQQLDQTFGGIMQSIDPARPAHIYDNPRYYDDPDSKNKALDEARVVLRRKFESWVKSRASSLKTAPLSSEEGVKLAYSVGLLSSKFPDVEILKILDTYGLAKFGSKPVQGREHSWLKWEIEGILEDYEKVPVWPLWVGRETPKSLANPDYRKYLELRKEADRLRSLGHEERASSLVKEAVELREKNYVRSAGYERQIKVPPDVGFHYISLLATQFATNLNSDMAADGEDYANTLFSDMRSVRGEVATSVLEAYLPESFYDLPAERIAEFRREFSTQRLKYEREIQSIVREFSDVASEGELGKLKDRITEIAIERVEETKRTYRRAKLEMMVKTFGMSVAPPAIAASVSSVLGIGIFAPAGITAALASVAATKLIEWDKANADRTKNPWSYVLDSAGLN